MLAALPALVTSGCAEQQPPCNHPFSERWAVFDSCRYLPVSYGVRPPRAISHPDPSFNLPSTALRDGTMEFTIAINKEGLVEAVRIRSSLTPQMDADAVEALRRWRFQPPLNNGLPVQVQMPVEIGFRRY